MSDLPIIQNYPQLQNQLQTRIEQLGPLLAQLQQPIPGAFAQLQSQRVNRGQAPWSLPESAFALAAAQRGQAVTQEPQRSPWSPGAFLSNIRHDLGAMLSSIPHLPSALLHEVTQLPQLPQAINQAAQSGSIGNVIENLSQAPGIRFIPGAWTAGNLAGGDFSELASHPLFTALDVLPAASGAAGLTKVGRAALEESALNAARPRALRAVVTRTLDDAGDLVPNRIGRAGQRIMDTRPGRLYEEAFGQQTRATMRMKAFQEQGVTEAFDRRAPLAKDASPLTRAARDMSNLYEDSKSVISDERWQEFNTLAQTDRAALRSAATPQELPFVDQFLDIGRRIEDIKLADDLMARYQGESYSWAEGSALLRKQARYDISVAKMQNEVIPRFEELQRSLEEKGMPRDERIDLILEHLRAGDYGFASKEMTNLMRRRTAIQSPSKVGIKVGPKSNIQLASLKNVANEIRKAGGARRSLEDAQLRAIPARFIPRVMEKEVLPRVEAAMRAKYEQMVKNGAITIPQSEVMIDQLVDALGRRFLDDVPELTAQELNKILRDSAKTWKDLKAQGADPIFVHHVHPDKAFREIHFPRIRTTEFDPTSVKQRMMDFTPTVTNPTIALTHEITELLLQRGTTAWLDQVEAAWGRSLDDIRQEFAGAARARYNRDPSVPFATHLDNLIKKKYVQYDRENWIRKFNGKPVTGTEAIKLRHLDPEARVPVYIPRGIAKNLDRLKPYNSESMGAMFDPVLNVFRTSVLPLSPRWHVNNIIGGAIMLAGQTNPLTVWRYFGDALNILRHDRGVIPIELRRTLGTANRDVIELNYLGGRTSRRLWDNIQEHFAKYGREGAVEKTRAAGRRIVQGSFDANVFVDDLYRTMSYLYGKSKAERHGLSVTEAEHAGLELARRTLQQWDEITPIERSILKSIIPFYGFTQHILRYTMKYPFDHPTRTAILGSVARAELEDLGTGLPQSYLDFMTFGRPDELGNQLGISTRGLNPFSDVADYFTLSGWVGASNPLISTLLQQSGIDAVSGQAELFPDLRYDPSTGQLTVEQGNFPTRLLNNIIPQSRVLTELLGRSNEFKELMQANPESARRLIQSQLGIPVNVRILNEPQELMKQEVRRFQSQREAFNTALSTGDDTYAREYPALRARLDQLRQLQSRGALVAFTPEANTPSFPDLLSPIPRKP